MGYYVEAEGNWRISNERHDAAVEALEALKALNGRNDLKQGGSWGGYQAKPADSLSLGEPDKWFSWMTWNYDETCVDLAEILDEIGFGYEKDDDGVAIVGYNQKSGQEELFLEALAAFSDEDSYIEFRGEDGDMWRNVVRNGIMVTQYGKVVWE